MKKQFLLILSFCWSISVFGQLFKANLKNTGSTLEVYFTVFGTGDMTTGYSQVEFYIRTPSSTPSFTVGTVMINSTDFSGNMPISLTSDNTADGFRTLHFGYAPTNSASSDTYTNGTEYLFATIPLSGNGGQGDFELAHDNGTFATYLNVTSDIGTDLSYATCVFQGTCPGENMFYGNTILNGNIHTTTVSNVSLPVELLTFDALPQNENVLLKWQTLTEINADYFEIEHSMNGSRFEKIGEQSAAGFSNATLNYEFLHKKPLTGINYYRLKMNDSDGRFEYSEIQSIDFSNAENQVNLHIFPNPVLNNHFTISSSTLHFKSAQLEIYDAVGRLIQFQPIFKMNTEIQTSNWAKGIYIVNLDVDGQRFWEKVVVD